MACPSFFLIFYPQDLNSDNSIFGKDNLLDRNFIVCGIQTDFFEIMGLMGLMGYDAM